MKLKLFADEINKVWMSVATDNPSELPQVELDLYKKLLTFFQVGDYFYYIFNFKTREFDVVSSGVETVLGYSPQFFNIEFYLDNIHPDDRPWFLSFESHTAEFLPQMDADKIMKYKVRSDYRIKKKDGSYIRVMHQALTIQIEGDGSITRSLGVLTDITHLKAEGKPVLSYIGMEGEPSYLDVDVKNIFVESKETLTPREKQVLRLLVEGKASKEIGAILNISKQTVDTHRKNMLNKNNLNNTGELIAKAIRNGWI
jgi:DNA-binding CsgD family transcriptional regulator